jgi:Uma2 family endonuclease
MSATAHLMTAEELGRLPEDGFRYELIRGELKKMAPAGYEYGNVAMELGWRLAQYVRENGLGKVQAAETGFLIASDPDTVRAPDVAFVSRERIEEVGEPEGFWPGAPDLAVEVVSPGDTYTEVEAKAIEWLEAGARLVIVVEPRCRTATVYRSLAEIAILTEKDVLSGGDVVPGWSMPVAGLFA